ncbi:MAG: thiolase domain-containing protein [Anaerolineales bacterium]
MRPVAILGIGQTIIDEQWEKSLRDIAAEAVISAMHDAGRETAEGVFVGNMMSGIINGQNNLGPLVADWAGLRGGDAVKVEAACASGAAAFRSGLMAVASGELESAIVVGVEKMTDRHPHEVTAALATAADADYEGDMGVSFVGLNALVMRRYMYEYGWKHADFAPFAINAHANAVHNPFARLRHTITVEDFEKSAMIATPINLLDASPIGDGAAAAYLIPADSLVSGASIRVVASASATDTIAIHDRPEALFLTAAYQSAREAYRQAGVEAADIDVFELHDAFTIMSALSLEACGFAERGKGVQLGLNGEITPTGRIPITTRGGLKARGHPVGATGVYQIVEVVQQLRGACGETQVPDARLGMAQNIGGSGATIITHILKAE